MASWQPPIPSGALYSKPARQLGAGVALLAYCYDMVRTDGWVELNLHTAAVAVDAPYPTVKAWWQLIKTAGIFKEIHDRGRNGIRARFDDYWVDWRILSTRIPTTKTGNETSGYPEKPTEETGVIREINETSSDTENKPAEVETPNREINGSYSGHQDISNPRAYKVLHDDHDSSSVATQPQGRKKRPAREPTDHQQLMNAYASWLGYKITNGAQEGKAARLLLTDGYTIEQIGNAYRQMKSEPFWSAKHLSLQAVRTQIGALLTAPQEQTNGQAHRNGVVQGSTGGEPSGDAANAAALERSGQRPERAPLRRATIDW